MRKLMMTATAIGIAAAGMTAAPAAAEAQRYGGYGYEQPRYDQRYAYNTRATANRLIRDVRQIRRDIRHFDRVNAISGKEARKLDKKARKVERRVYKKSRNGLHRGEVRELRQDIRQLHRELRRDVRDGRHGRYGYGYRDNDRYDDDRWEDRRERRRDWRRDRRDD